LEGRVVAHRIVFSHLSSNVLPSHFQPRFVRDFEIHDCEEWIDLVLLFDDTVKDLIIVNDLALSLLLPSCKEDRELRSQLKNLHSLVDFHVAVLLSHTSVEQFIEIDISTVAIDGHFEYLLLQLSVIEVFFTKTKTVILVTEIAKSSKKASQLIFFDFVASVSILSQLLPDFHEAGKIILEFGDHVFFGKIILFKLLNNNQNEKVEHDV
jgi:hypothetical protein